MENVSDLINQIREMSEKRLFEPKINYIRFPRYKKLENFSKINFDFPLTVLVGVNGTNKTSILQALYGACQNKSVGLYWFSTSVDKIDEDKNQPNCFIYSYFHAGANKDVEVLKCRINKANNPDYWETSRPVKKYQMQLIDEDLLQYNNSAKTRWDPIDKNVVFCDFKEYISAFDMYFYNFNFQKSKRTLSKQDFLRQRSKCVITSINNNLKEYMLCKKQRIQKNEKVSDEVCKIVSEIMGKKYEEIYILTHNFYTKNSDIRPLKTIFLKEENSMYSEAFAGSGESRLIMLINDIVNSPEKSLILIDEPEINLHPSAINKFQYFLLKQIIKKHHQIVLTTHSHNMIAGLPVESIKLLKTNKGKIFIEENVDYREAFVELGEKLDKKVTIFVEDRLVETIVSTIINKNKSMKQGISVKSLGGVQNIIKRHILSSSLKDDRNSLYLLDGDANKLFFDEFEYIRKEWINNECIDESAIPAEKNKYLDEIIKELTGVAIDVKSNIGMSISEKKLFEYQRKFLKYWSEYVRFLPTDKTPEEFISDLVGDEERLKYENRKDYYKHKANSLFATCDSNAILHAQKMDITLLVNQNNSDIKKIEEIIKNWWDKT